MYKKSDVWTIAPKENFPRLGLRFGLDLDLDYTIFLGAIILEP